MKPPAAEPGVEQVRRPNPARIALRIAIGAGVVGFLLLRGDADRVWSALGAMNVAFALGAVAAMLGGLLVGAFRWQAYLRALDLALRPRPLVRLSFVGTFFNAFLPTGVGGDAYKAMRLRVRSARLTPPLTSVLLDRFAGIVGMAVIGSAGVAIRSSEGDRNGVVLLAGLICAGLLAAALAILALGPRLARVDALARTRAGTKVSGFLDTFVPAARDSRASARGIAAGLAFQAVVLLFHVLLASALGLGVSVAALACLVAIAGVATMIPVTVNGLGFRESVYVWGLGAYGVSHESAVAFALLVLGVLLAASAVGGLVYVVAGGDVDASSFASSASPDAKSR